MKNYNFTRAALLCSALAGVFACQKTEPVHVTTTPMTVSAQINETAAAATGKASGLRTTGFVVGDQIGLYVVANLKSETAGRLEVEGNYVDNVASTLTTGSPDKWVNNAIFYPTVNVSVYGYYPYASNFKPAAAQAPIEFTVGGDQSSATKVTSFDFMTAKLEPFAGSATPLELAFYHRLSKVDVTFTVPATFRGRKIDKVQSITLLGLKNKASIDLTSKYEYDADGTLAAANGTFPKSATTATGATIETITPNEVSAEKDVDGKIVCLYEAITVPQSVAVGTKMIEIVVQYAGSTDTEIFYYEVATAAVKFEAGKATAINITFQNEYTLLLGNTNIVDWGNAADNNGNVVNREVYNQFELTLSAAEATQIVRAELDVWEGLPLVQTTPAYSLKVTHTAASTDVKFAFDGLQKSPDFYPFTIKAVKFFDVNGNELTASEITGKNKSITRTGKVTSLD